MATDKGYASSVIWFDPTADASATPSPPGAPSWRPRAGLECSADRRAGCATGPRPVESGATPIPTGRHTHVSVCSTIFNPGPGDDPHAPTLISEKGQRPDRGAVHRPVSRRHPAVVYDHGRVKIGRTRPSCRGGPLIRLSADGGRGSCGSCLSSAPPMPTLPRVTYEFDAQDEPIADAEALGGRAFADEVTSRGHRRGRSGQPETAPETNRRGAA